MLPTNKSKQKEKEPETKTNNKHRRIEKEPGECAQTRNIEWLRLSWDEHKYAQSPHHLMSVYELILNMWDTPQTFIDVILIQHALKGHSRAKCLDNKGRHHVENNVLKHKTTLKTIKQTKQNRTTTTI